MYKVAIILISLAVIATAKPKLGKKLCSMENVDCSKFGEKAVCDQNDNVYENRCDFVVNGWCKNNATVLHDCDTKMPITRKPKPTRPDPCPKILIADCSALEGKKNRPLCDRDGNMYQNGCFFRQAACKMGSFKALRRRRCPKTTRAPATPSA